MAEEDAVPRLTSEQIRHFKREGYVICYGLLPENLMAACRERLWQDAPASMCADDPDSWVGPIAKEDETGSGMHGISVNSRSGYIWKERVAGAEQLMLDLLPKRLAPIAEQLLGPGVYPPTGEDVGTMLGLPDDQNFPAELQHIANSSDIGIRPLCARFLSLIDSHNFPVPLPRGARLHDMFVVGSRARGIYATLPQQPGSQQPFVTGGGHNDGHPFQLGVEAYIDDVPVRVTCCGLWIALLKTAWQLTMVVPQCVYLTSSRYHFFFSLQPNGGGFQYWPKAHRRLFPHYLRQHSRDPVDTTNNGAWGTAPSSVIQQIAQDTKPVDCYGPAGTCM